MICPVCQKLMVSQDFGGVNVEVCLNGCKGLWFDWGQVNKLDHKNQGFGAALQAALNAPRQNDQNRGPIKCPKCGIDMHRHQFESEKEINVDECYGCGGFFLDSGDLKVIRDNVMSEDEREDYEEKLLNNIPSYVQGEATLEKYSQRTEAISKYTRFIRSDYYEKGQQMLEKEFGAP